MKENGKKKNRKKRGKKYIRLFFLSFLITLLLGGVGFGVYVLTHPAEKEAVSVMSDENGVEADCTSVNMDASQNDREEMVAISKNETLPETETVPETEVENDLENHLGNNTENAEKPADNYEEKLFYRDTKVSGEAELVFGGDICFYDDFALMVSYRARQEDISKCISQDLLDEIHSADVFMLNNEFVYSDRGEPLAEKAFTFRSKPENVEILHKLGVDIVGLGNNHVFDYGENALLDTFSILEEEEMPYVGAGRNLEQARKPAYFHFDDFTVAYVNATQIERNDAPDTKGATDYSAGTFRCFSKQEFANLQETIKLAKEKADFVVVYIHWGTENTDELDWAQNYQAPLIVEAGADLIIGNHTHCLQGIDYIGNTPVIYSTGNFWFNSKELDTCIVKAVVTKDGLESFQFLPAKQENCATALLEGTEREQVLEYMRNISPNVVIDESGYVFHE